MKLGSNIYNNIIDFLRKRFIEFFGLILITLFLFFIYSLIRYSPENSTLIFKTDEITSKHFLEIYVNATADFFLQSFGLISFLFAITLLSWSLNLILQKKIEKILNKILYSILYIIFGCLFLYTTFNNSFWLIDNGNSGFVGERFYNLIQRFSPLIEHNISKVTLLILALSFFILSIGINIKYFFSIFFNLLIFKNKIKKNKNEQENIPEQMQNYTKENVLKQQSFSFKSQSEKVSSEYKLPSINLLEKKQSQILKNQNSKIHSGDFIEKILLDFGIEGQVKKINNGPVVNLYEFEPAPGIKVSKIINLADDIARNTSSISARVSIIPGKNTLGIEIPNSKRENVILSEIFSSSNFGRREIKLPIALGKNISGLPVVNSESP